MNAAVFKPKATRDRFNNAAAVGGGMGIRELEESITKFKAPFSQSDQEYTLSFPVLGGDGQVLHLFVDGGDFGFKTICGKVFEDLPSKGGSYCYKCGSEIRKIRFMSPEMERLSLLIESEARFMKLLEEHELGLHKRYRPHCGPCQAIREMRN